VQIRRFLHSSSLKYLGDIALIGSASGIQMALLAVLGVLLAHYLSVEDFGIIRTVTAYLVVLTIFGHCCLHDSIAAHVAGTDTDISKSTYIINGTYLVLIIALAVVVSFEFLIHYSNLWTGKLKHTLSIIVILLPAMSLAIVYSSLLQAVGQYKKLTLSLIVGGLIPLVIITPFAALWELSGWIIARCLSDIILVSIAFYLIKDFIITSAKDERAGSHLMAFAKVQIVSGILSMTMQSADIISLERISNRMEDVAVYGLAALFGKSVMFFPGAVGRVYFLDIAEARNDRRTLIHHVNHLMLMTSAICIMIAVSLFFLAPFLLNIIYGSKYNCSISVLRIMCYGMIFSGIWSALSVVNIALKQPRNSVIISATGVSACIPLLLILVPAYGPEGAAWGMNGAYFTGSLIGLWLFYRIKSANPLAQN
jgi:O-antigen/teichoic acid export membrane protein